MASRRRSIEIEGVAHGAPIPMGSRVDNIVYSSAIMGTDPRTGKIPEDGAAQVRQAFANLQSFLAAAGCTAEDVVRVSVLLGDDSLRSPINEEWVALFPDAESRPARHISRQSLAGGYLLQLEVVAVAAS